MPASSWRDELARFEPTVDHAAGSTPPASWYTRAEFHELELRSVFRQTWQPVARVELLTSPGTFVTAEVAGWPVIVVRGSDGQLRAFDNVCRHHAALVAQGEGCATELVCPYHSWTYGLDGRLLRAPRMGAVTDFDRADFSLPEVTTAIWGPFVWIHGGQPSSEPADDFRTLHERLSTTGFERLKFVARKSYALRCNWKVYVDNYLDGGYHVAHLHKGLASALDLAGYRTELFPRYSIQSAGGAAQRDSRVGDSALYAWLYPNFMINRYGPVMDTNWVLPLAPDRCLTVFDFYFSPECDQEFIATSLEASDLVQSEDVGICESVQHGLGSGSYDRGRYAAGLEYGEHQFHCLLAADLRTATEE